MQYGNLTSDEKTIFLAAQKSLVNTPSFGIFIEGLGDISTYIEKIQTTVGIEGPTGRGSIHVGSGLITASNQENTFYNNGKATTRKNAAITIWGGYNTLTIPIFTGYINSISPISHNDTVSINLKDQMGLFVEPRIEGIQGSNTTIKTIIEKFCSDLGITDAIDSDDEITRELKKASLEPQTILSALRRLCDSVFYVPFCDEIGTFYMRPREYSNHTTWVYHDRNTITATRLANSEVINKVSLEYRDNWYATYADTASIDEHRLKERDLRLLFQNYTPVASKTTGSTPETLDNDLEGFYFTSATDAANIDCIAVKLKATGASGVINMKLYSNDSGEPLTLLGTSDDSYAGNIYTQGFAWHYFRFTPPLAISPSTNYWGIVNTATVTGTIETYSSRAVATAKHAYGTWTTENNKYMLHDIRSSIPSQRTVEDIVRFHGQPRDRIKIIAPAVPHLQLWDEVIVDLETPFEITGRYIIEGRSHIMTPNGYITTDKLAAVLE